MSSEDKNGEESAVDLLVHSLEVCVRTNWQLMKVPLVVYTDLVDTWAKSVDAIVENIKSKE